MTRQSLWFCIRHVATNNLKLHECHYHSGTLQTANTCNFILINQCSLNHTKDKKIKTENKVRTITSALLVFIHHWYIIVWWKNWKNYPYYSLWLSTRTRILAWKTRRGGREKASRQGEGHVMYTCSFTHHHLSAYLPVPTGTHLAAKHEEQNRSLLTNLTTFNPSSIVSFFLLDTVKGLTPVDVGSSKLSINS